MNSGSKKTDQGHLNSFCSLSGFIGLSGIMSPALASARCAVNVQNWRDGLARCCEIPIIVSHIRRKPAGDFITRCTSVSLAYSLPRIL